MRERLKYGVLLLLTMLCLFAVGCGKKTEETAEATATPDLEQSLPPVEIVETEDVSFTESVKEAVNEGDIQKLYEKLRYWDSTADKSGKFSKAMISEFLSYVEENPEEIDGFLEDVEDLYEEGSEVVYLPAVYIQITSDTDNTVLSVPVFGKQTITNAATKAMKLGPMLPMQYRIAASNDDWSEEKTQVIKVTFEELNTGTAGADDTQAENAGKHTYYVNFRGNSGSAAETKAPDVNTSSDGRYVAIDAGHQQHGDSDTEPIGPGASETKPKVASGTSGVSTGIPEYELTLAVAQKLKAELESRGYRVLMIRESNDVNISNRERAQTANNSGADIFVRLHADGAQNSSASGCSTLYPGPDNPYVSGISSASRLLSEEIVDRLSAKTGFENRGAVIRDDMSGINWCTIPVSIVEMGFMTNAAQDEEMATEECRQKIAEGIADGIDAYFKQVE